jgi:c-di-AMP phosphodiesterase-like protein
VETIKELREKLGKEINDSDEVFITPHNDPDFDAIASAIGTSEICTKFKKENYIIVDKSPLIIQPGVKKVIDETQDKYKYINLDEFNKMKDKVSRKLLITVDVNKTYLVSINKELQYFKNIIIIDHHKSDENTIVTSDVFIDPLISSTSEIIYNLIKYYNVKIDSYTAAYLLSGIMVDTARYTRNVSDRTLANAAKLTKKM